MKKERVKMVNIKKVNVETTWVENFLIEVKARDHKIYVDQPETAGGQNKGLTPLEHLLVSLGGCIISLGLIIAKQKHIKLKNFNVSIEGEIDYDVLLGEATQPRAGFYKIIVKAKLEANLSEEDKKEFINEIKSRCPIADNLSNITPIEIVLE